ncbi:MAG TPA: TonB-dependent receptor [Blastocatellia bacterium]|nr:TonB-dependent receptor [Blastocatellia bacterium]
MSDRSGFKVVLGIIFLIGCSLPAWSQVSATVAQLNGTVQDANGAVVVGAAISLRAVDTNQEYSATSNDAGYYLIPNLPPGNYELTVTSTGFGKYTRTGIVLTVAQAATVNVSLSPTVEQTVTVTTDTVIEPTRTESSQVINPQQIESLPVSGRLFTDFALLTPGVATGRTSLGTTFTEFEITQISFGGMRSFSNMITVDGADFINSNTGVQRATPPQESVQEFRVVNSSFGTEYGRALGGIVNVVTKSGTNEWHGSGYEYFQNDALNARSLLQPSPQSDTLRQNQFGATIGGPIKKDKTFFFANYEGQRRSEAPVLSPDFLNNFTAINRAKAYLGLAPEDLSVLKIKHNDYGFLRLDHQVNANNRVAVRYNIENANDPNQLVGNTEDGGGIGAPSGGRNLAIRDQSLVGTVSSLLSPNLVNTALVQYARRHYDFPGVTGQPDLDVPNDLSFGHNFGTLDAIYETRLQLSDNLGWVRGNHYFKFGYDTNQVWDYTIYPGFTPARIILPDLNCMMAFANFVNIPGGPALPSIPGPPCPLPPFFNGVGATFYGVALARTGYVDGQAPLNNAHPLDIKTWANAFPTELKSNYAYNLQHGYQGFFAQDQWRATPKLSLNYGLRYDFETGLTDQIDSYYGGIQPRVGVAYSPDDKTVIRAGFGIFFDRENMTFFFITGDQKTVPGFIPGINLPMIRRGAETGGWELNLVNAAAFLPAPLKCAGVDVGGGFCLGAAATAAKSILTTGMYPQEFITGPCPPACTGGAGGMDRHNNKLPYSEQASLEVERQVKKGLTLGGGYLFVSAHRLVLGNGLNTPCPQGTSKPSNPAIAQGWLNPDGSISDCVGTPKLLAGKPVFSDSLEFPNGGFLDYNFGAVSAMYNGLSLRVVERAGKYFNLNANYTFSHIIDNGNFTTFINLPQNQFDNKSERSNSNQDVRHRFVANFSANTPDRSFIRNFTLSGVITVQSGRPFTLFTGGDSNGDTNPVTDRVGLLDRNTYIGDPLRSVDLRLSRFFQIREHTRLDLIFDAFNVFNRPNVDEIFSVYGSPILCGATPMHYKDPASLAIQAGQSACPAFTPPAGVVVPSQFFVPPAPNANFGTPRTMFNPRQLQIAAKVTF